MDNIVQILLYTSAGIILLAVLIALIRFLKGPTITDRVVAFDMTTVSSIALIALISFFAGRVIYLDVAIVYGLLSFLGVLIVAKYLEKGL